MKPRPSNAFTLVELMITIAIIAVLVGLGVTASSRAMTMARQATCANNLRQLHLILSNYATENNGLMPAGKNNNVNGSLSSWMIVVQVYMGWDFPIANQKNAFLCPEARKTFPGGKARRTYAMNTAGTDGTIPIRPVNYPQPGQVAFLMDAVSNGVPDGDSRSVFGQNDYTSCTDYRHDECLNVLFLDGHVEPFTAAQGDTLRTAILNIKR